MPNLKTLEGAPGRLSNIIPIVQNWGKGITQWDSYDGARYQHRPAKTGYCGLCGGVICSNPIADFRGPSGIYRLKKMFADRMGLTSVRSLSMAMLKPPSLHLSRHSMDERQVVLRKFPENSLSQVQQWASLVDGGTDSQHFGWPPISPISSPISPNQKGTLLQY